MKKVIILVILVVFSRILFAQFQGGAGVGGIGTLPARVDSLSQSMAPIYGSTYVGVEIYNRKDSTKYRWDGLAWKANNINPMYATWDTTTAISNRLKSNVVRTDTLVLQMGAINPLMMTLGGQVTYINGQIVSINGILVTKADTGSLKSLERRVVLDSLNADVRSRAAQSLTTFPGAIPVYSSITGILNIPPPFSDIKTTTSGIATFYLTKDKTATGAALFTTVNSVVPIINDAANNYTYGWVLSGKTLTVTAKISTQNAIALLGLTLLGVPANVANGTSIQVLVQGQ